MFRLVMLLYFPIDNFYYISRKLRPLLSVKLIFFFSEVFLDKGLTFELDEDGFSASVLVVTACLGVVLVVVYIAYYYYICSCHIAVF